MCLAGVDLGDVKDSGRDCSPEAGCGRGVWSAEAVVSARLARKRKG